MFLPQLYHVFEATLNWKLSYFQHFEQPFFMYVQVKLPKS